MNYIKLYKSVPYFAILGLILLTIALETLNGFFAVAGLACMAVVFTALACLIFNPKSFYGYDIYSFGKKSS